MVNYRQQSTQFCIRYLGHGIALIATEKALGKRPNGWQRLVNMAGVAGSKSWQACCLSRFQSTRSLVAWVDSGTQESHREDTMVYPSSGQFGPYVQQLMILILKSTQNLGGYNRV
jgi:hypothetical protein